MHALLMVVGSRGDVQPLLALATGLQTAGHRATLVAPTLFRDEIEARGGAADAALREAEAALGSR